MSQVSLGSVMMTAEAREQNEEESIKCTVAALANFTHFILPGRMESSVIAHDRSGFEMEIT